MKTTFLALLLCCSCSSNPPVSQDEKQVKTGNSNFIGPAMNDPLLPFQKYIYETSINRAWTITTGNPNIKIAVIDGEIKPHEDLLLLKSYIYSLDAPITHATPIAGIIGATQNNGKGMAGITKCTLISYVAQTQPQPGGDFTVSAVEKSFYQAIKDGVKIINCSFRVREDIIVLRTAVGYAIQRGIVVVAAAGNDGTDEKNYPAAYPSVIGVGSTVDGARASWSNYGSWITVSAPGQGLLSELPDQTTMISGTSASAPIVSGVVALVLSVNPKLKPEKIKQIIQQSSKAGQLDAYQAVKKSKEK